MQVSLFWLFDQMSICLFVCLSVCLSDCLSVSPTVWPSICLFVFLYVCFFVCRYVCLSILCLSILYLYLCVCFYVCLSCLLDVRLPGCLLSTLSLWAWVVINNLWLNLINWTFSLIFQLTYETRTLLELMFSGVFSQRQVLAAKSNVWGLQVLLSSRLPPYPNLIDWAKNTSLDKRLKRQHCEYCLSIFKFFCHSNYYDDVVS